MTQANNNRKTIEAQIENLTAERTRLIQELNACDYKFEEDEVRPKLEAVVRYINALKRNVNL
jgi:hypothetical protein